MHTVLIGAGNVATVLGRLMKEKGHNILQVINRNIAPAKILADELQAKPCNEIKKITPDGDIYIIAVSDDAIAMVADKLQAQGKIVVHTSGATNKNVLRNSSDNYGVLYPLQSLRKETGVLSFIPLFVDGSSKDVTEKLFAFAKTLSGVVDIADDEKRLKLHLSAVIVSNFSNHLYALAENFCERENINFAVLAPLIHEVAGRMPQFSPARMQTGPAIRGDRLTMEKHIQLLADYPQLKKIYEIMSESIESSVH
jgi:predicted short-subunit dehydrogenase-like oxidoreductase (DUF2520 family)